MRESDFPSYCVVYNTFTTQDTLTNSFPIQGWKIHLVSTPAQ